MERVEATEEEIKTEQERLALLVLVRAGLWEREPEHTTCFPLPEESWENVFRLARQQTVTGLAFQGLRHLSDNLLPAENLLVRWAAETDAIERRNRKMNEVLKQLYEAFRQQGLNPVLQKGQGVARYYEHPLTRECGDIDLYFNNLHAWDSALVCLRLHRVRMKKQADKGIYYQWLGMDVEHHPRLLDLYNPFLQRFVGRLEKKNGYRHFVLPSAPDTRITVPSPFMDLLLQNLHILKHCLGRGIGLRQLCDMARACYRLHSEVDAQEMEKVCRKLGLERWCLLLHAFLTDCLGLPAGCLPYSGTAPTAQPLADIIWRGGNFGQHNARWVQKNTGWRRKCQTARSFGHNVRFVFHYAPKEAFWFFLLLMKGQIK